MAKKKSRVNRQPKNRRPDSPTVLTSLTVTRERIRNGLMLSFVVVLVFLIYSKTLEAPFVFDDWHNIENNPDIRITELHPKSIAVVGLKKSANRPLAHITFALNYYFGQYDVTGYHLVNIFVHILTGLFLYLFLKTTVLLVQDNDCLTTKSFNPSTIAFFSALLWLVHPIQTQSVTYIVQRMNSMAAMFYILSCLLYAKARLAEGRWKQWGLFAGCILAGVLALGSKEIAVTLPFFVFLYEWYFFQDLSWTWLKRHFVHVSVLLILLAIVTWTYLGAHPMQKILSGYKGWDFSLTQRVLTEFRVIIFYISLLTFPHPSRLNLDHDFPLSHSLTDPTTTLVSMGAIVSLVGLAIYLAKKERLISFCILWFFGNLAIESSVIALDIIFEHRTYLPSMLVCLTAVMLAYRLINPKWLRVAVLCGVVIVCCVWTYERNNVWSDEVTLFNDCVEKSPKKARPHNELGTVLAEQDRTDEAIKHFSEALRIKPDHAIAHANLATALAKHGRTEEAIRHFSQALRIRPNFKEAHYNLGNALIRERRLEEAIVHLREALRLDPDFLKANDKLEKALAALKLINRAITENQQALKVNPGKPALHCNLAYLYESQGRLDEAISHYEEALSNQPEFVRALNNLALVYGVKKEYDKALSLFRKMTELRPESADIYYNIASIYARQNKMEDSVDWLKKAVDKGYKNWDFLKTDKDLESIRGSSYYKELIRSR